MCLYRIMTCLESPISTHLQPYNKSWFNPPIFVCFFLAEAGTRDISKVTFKNYHWN